ncbi:MAG: peptidylprolyl isomerase [Lentisphaeria bacterium]|nr:peptidylprolyl isomerase [Candidatus Neomarinimicrobiota bacterium]MCF7841291.1 peptidylprolyl isomerase [Lentisphaeria bacterium]
MSAQSLVDGLAAIVGQKAILYSEVEQMAQLISAQQRIDPYQNPEAYNQLRYSALDELINQQVLLEYARQETIEVRDRDVEAQVEQLMGNLEQQYGGLNQVEQTFGISPRKIRRYYQDQIHSNQIIEAVKRELFSNITVSRREVEAFFHTNRDSFPDINPAVDFSIISLPLEAGSRAREAARDTLLAIRERIRAGSASFGEMAGRYSQDPGSAANGGNIGFTSRGTFVKPFEAAAYSLEPGEMSDVIETQFGLHLIKLEERRGEKVNVSHILIKPQASQADVQALTDSLTSLRDAILAGKLTFAEAAKQYLTDPDLKARNGRVGKTDITTMPEGMQKILSSLPAGEISRPFPALDQVNIILVHERFPGGKLTLKNNWFELESMTLQQKQMERLEKWIQEQREKMYINVKMIL